MVHVSVFIWYSDTSPQIWTW